MSGSAPVGAVAFVVHPLARFQVEEVREGLGASATGGRGSVPTLHCSTVSLC